MMDGSALILIDIKDKVNPVILDVFDHDDGINGCLIVNNETALLLQTKNGTRTLPLIIDHAI